MELNRQQDAYETLSAAAALFPGDEIIPYDLACVCCALKRVDEAVVGNNSIRRENARLLTDFLEAAGACFAG
jgi:hypothetical protein